MNAIEPGELVISSRRIFTMNGDRNVLDGSIVVRDGRIERVVPSGSAVPHDLPVIDVGERPVLPGFVDPHVHLEMAATAMWGAVDCHTPPCRSIDELVEQLHSHLDLREQRGGWLVGQGGLFAERRFSDQRLPNRHDLDRVSTTVPIAVRFGAHVTVVNTRGLELAQAEQLPETGDAYVGREADGSLDGVLHELFYALPIPSLTEQQMVEAIAETTERYLTRYGVTTVGEVTNTETGMKMLGERAGTHMVPLTVDAFIWAPGTVPLDMLLARRCSGEFEFQSSSFRYRGIKVFVDGGFSAAGAAVLRPYARLRDGVEQSGRMAFDLSGLADLVRSTDELGLQLAAHVNGEAAQRALCQAAVLARRSTGGGLPVRMEHGGNVLTDDATLEYWSEAAAIPIPQAGFLYTMGSFIPQSMGDYAYPALFRFRDLIDKGWNISSSSDGAGSELLQFNPLFGVQCAVTRTSCIGEVLGADQAVTVMEGLAMHTSAAAAAMGLHHDRGSIQSGLRADLIVLGEDPREVAPERISTVTIDSVIVNGTVVREYR